MPIGGMRCAFPPYALRGEFSLILRRKPQRAIVIDRDLVPGRDWRERDQIERLREYRAKRRSDDVAAALRALTDAARSNENTMPASIRCAHAGVTTGEWGDALRKVFGEYSPVNTV